ncbi:MULTISPECIES: hypothetical protein [unclassified Rhizobium]|uniref:hypothetical protein n=1 Tax=unclassified Rhizobium TaxID=2613769 RepID=UPI0012E39AC4|nr:MULTISPECIES: hypothetical protein [unclassified Rhizobium]
MLEQISILQTFDASQNPVLRIGKNESADGSGNKNHKKQMAFYGFSNVECQDGGETGEKECLRGCKYVYSAVQIGVGVLMDFLGTLPIFGHWKRRLLFPRMHGDLPLRVHTPTMHPASPRSISQKAVDKRLQPARTPGKIG